MRNTFDVAVVGATGVVGETMLSILEEREFPVGNLYPLASRRSAGSCIEFKGTKYTVGDLEEFDFANVQIGLFSAGASVSARHAPRAGDAGCVVVAAEPGREWAFEVPAQDGRRTLWRYEIEPNDVGCRVTESFDSPILDQEFVQKMNRHSLLVNNIAKSLENLKAVAEG